MHAALTPRMRVLVQGAAALISNKAYLTDAAGILAVEAYHGEPPLVLEFGEGLPSYTVVRQWY